MPITLEQIAAQLDRIEALLEDTKEGQERLEEAVANVSLPGTNFDIHYGEQE